MTSNLDIYGNDAALHAAQCADELPAAVAGEIKAVWRWVKRRI